MTGEYARRTEAAPVPSRRQPSRIPAEVTGTVLGVVEVSRALPNARHSLHDDPTA